MPSANRRSALASAAAVVATAAMAGTGTTVEAFSPVVSMSRTPAMMKPSAAATALRMSTADDEVAKLRAAAQKAREEAQALAKVSRCNSNVALSTFLDMQPYVFFEEQQRYGRLNVRFYSHYLSHRHPSAQFIQLKLAGHGKGHRNNGQAGCSGGTASQGH